MHTTFAPAGLHSGPALGGLLQPLVLLGQALLRSDNIGAADDGREAEHVFKWIRGLCARIHE